MFVSIRALIVAGGMLTASVVGFSAEHTKDALSTVKENMATKKAVLVDVRDQDEWDRGHIVGASLSPLSKLRDAKGLEEALKQLPKDRILYTHCAIGVRSVHAAEILKKHGYDVRPLKPGYLDLVKAGFPDSAKK
jgi:phage shock protein E